MDWRFIRRPRSQTVRVGLRNAREGELEDFLAAQVRATRAIDDAARKADGPCAQALPADLGDWQSTVEFVLGPYAFAKDLAQLSAVDFARAAERNAGAFCRQGYGALLAGLGGGLVAQVSTPVSAIEVDRNVTVQTPRGGIVARTAIVTASANVLAAGRIRFTPDLPRRLTDAFTSLSLGSYDHIALELAGNPLGLNSDDLVFEKSNGARTGAILANVSGTSLCLINIAGAFGRDLSAQGEAAMVDFAADWLSRLYGAEVKRAVKRSSATRWNSRSVDARRQAWRLRRAGAAARSTMAEPVREALWFAGDAVHDLFWGTVGGAWESGERAADAALRRLAGQREPVAEEKKAQAQPNRRPRSEPRALPEITGTPEITCAASRR